MDGMSFEEAWRGDDGLSLRYKERLILALEDILLCVEVNGGVINMNNAVMVAEWWSNGSEQDLSYMINDVVGFIAANTASTQNGD